MNKLNAEGMVHYFWSAIVGTERSIGFAHMMKQEGFVRFEEVIDDFRIRFNDNWLNSQRIAEAMIVKNTNFNLHHGTMHY